MGLETFLERTRKYEAKKIKVIEKEIEDFGEIRFNRPPQRELLEYLESLTSQAKPKQGKEVEIELEIGILARAASKLVYNCCIEMQSKEFREIYKGIDNFEIPLELFGATTVMELGNFISTEFGAVKAKEEAVETIKNSLEGTANTETFIG